MFSSRSYRVPTGWACFLLALAGWVMEPCLGHTETPSYTEQQLKVLFILNFARYTTWPKDTLAETNATFTLGVVGSSLSDEALNLIRGKTIKNRELVIKRFADSLDAAARQQELEGCQLLFIGASEKSSLPELFRLLGNSSVLTIGEADGFLDQGGVINLVVVKNKLSFEIKQGAAQKANLKLDTQLLKLAQVVRE